MGFGITILYWGYTRLDRFTSIKFLSISVKFPHGSFPLSVNWALKFIVKAHVLETCLD
jgi:hypothetical protein